MGGPVLASFIKAQKGYQFKAGRIYKYHPFQRLVSMRMSLQKVSIKEMTDARFFKCFAVDSPRCSSIIILQPPYSRRVVQNAARIDRLFQSYERQGGEYAHE
ncbi:MAG: hypothetical protein RLZZ419_1172 [Pseudomonadota bacterium]